MSNVSYAFAASFSRGVIAYRVYRLLVRNGVSSEPREVRIYNTLRLSAARSSSQQRWTTPKPSHSGSQVSSSPHMPSCGMQTRCVTRLFLFPLHSSIVGRGSSGRSLHSEGLTCPSFPTLLPVDLRSMGKKCSTKVIRRYGLVSKQQCL